MVMTLHVSVLVTGDDDIAVLVTGDDGTAMTVTGDDDIAGVSASYR